MGFWWRLTNGGGEEGRRHVAAVRPNALHLDSNRVASSNKCTMPTTESSGNFGGDRNSWAGRAAWCGVRKAEE